MRFKCGSNLESMGLSIGGVTMLVEDDFGDQEDDDEEAIDGDDDDLEGVFQGLGLGAQGGGGRRGHGKNQKSLGKKEKKEINFSYQL